jgi:hypothetical protein
MTSDTTATNHERRGRRTKTSNIGKSSCIVDRHLLVVLPTLLLGWSSLFWKGGAFPGAHAFHHNSCSSDVAKKFQFADCYLPDLADDLLLSEAGFLLSHDAATGYLKKSSGLLTNGATNLYSKNQIGDVYQQLDDGARALDVRPKILTNGTIVLHHGSLPIAVTLERLVIDARRWAVDNPDELVLIFHSDFDYASTKTSSSSSYNDDDGNQDGDDDGDGDDDNASANDDDATDDDAIVASADTTVAALSQVYANLGVTYVTCADLYGLTVSEAKELAQLSPVNYSTGDDDASGGDDSYGDDNGNENEPGQTDAPTESPTKSPTQAPTETDYGYLLAMDRHDVYAGSCAKQNYVANRIVTCYSSNNEILPCTDHKSVQHRKLKEYALASANNEPTDSNSVLGPPASTYYYPFNEVQTLWQVDGISAALGVSHVSSIIDDNTKSHLNARVVDWVYNEEFDGISLLAVDHVRLNGNALTSVLRNRCGQSELSYGENDNHQGHGQSQWEIPCGTAIRKPQIRQGKPLSTLSFFATAMVCMVLGMWIAVGLAHYRKHHDHEKEVEILEKDLKKAMYQCGCTEALNPSDSEDIGEIISDSIHKSDKQDPLIRLPVID